MMPLKAVIPPNDFQKIFAYVEVGMKPYECEGTSMDASLGAEFFSEWPYKR